MTGIRSPEIAFSGSRNSNGTQQDLSSYAPTLTQEIPSAIDSQNSSHHDSLNSQETALSMSQETSLSFQDESRLGVGISPQTTRPAGTRPLASKEIEISTHPSANREMLQSAGHGYDRIYPNPDRSLLAKLRSKNSGQQHQSLKESIIGNAPPRLDTTAGQKRTASGHIKTPSSSVSPHDADSRGSIDMLNGSPAKSSQKSPQIGQLTAQLRTRLSYAMVKVQKGWESKNINEVETLAAQRHASVSPTRGNEQRHNGQPTKVSASPERPVFMYSNIRTQISPNRQSAQPREKPSPSRLSSSSSSLSEKLHISIEKHRSHPTSSKLGGPSLAPPVDLSPRNPRRSNPPAFEAPKLAGNGIKAMSNLSGSSVSSSATPPTGQRPLVQTPSQQNASAMEQDAIETLLFMSSPGNSQYRPPSQPRPPGSPLRTVLSPEKRAKVRTLELDKATRSPNDDIAPLSPRKKTFLEKANLENSENIDKVLDNMPTEDSSSSDEEGMSIDGPIAR